MTEYIKEIKQVEILKPKDLTITLQKDNKREYSFGKYLSKEEINSCLSAIPSENSKHLMFFQFLWRTGVRVTEALSLRKEQINFNDSFIEIKWLKSRKFEKRIIPLHSSLKHPLLLFCSALKYDERLFPWTRQNADFYAKKYSFGHCHVLRHSFAVNFIKQNRSAWALAILQKLLGHKRINTTMKYLNAVPIDQANALSEINFD